MHNGGTIDSEIYNIRVLDGNIRGNKSKHIFLPLKKATDLRGNGIF